MPRRSAGNPTAASNTRWRKPSAKRSAPPSPCTSTTSPTSSWMAIRSNQPSASIAPSCPRPSTARWPRTRKSMSTITRTAVNAATTTSMRKTANAATTMSMNTRKKFPKCSIRPIRSICARRRTARTRTIRSSTATPSMSGTSRCSGFTSTRIIRSTCMAFCTSRA